MTALATNNRTEDAADREFARRRFFAVFNEQFPGASKSRSLRLAILTDLLSPGRPILSCGDWDARKYSFAADRIRRLADDTAAALSDRAYEALPEPEPRPAPVEFDAERLAEVDAGIREWAEVMTRARWVSADLLAEALDLTLAGGGKPKVELARLAKVSGLKLNTAQRWVLLSRLVPEEMRAEFPDLSWSCLEAAVSHWQPGQTPTAEAVRDRLELASNNQWTATGLTAHLLGGKPAPAGPHPSRAALETLCANVTDRAAAEVRGVWAIVDATVSMRRRKVSP